MVTRLTEAERDTLTLRGGGLCYLPGGAAPRPASAEELTRALVMTLLAERRGFLTPAEANGRLERLMRGRLPAPICVACGTWEGVGQEEGYCLKCATRRLKERLEDGWRPYQPQV
jgi:hypothetical protein